jgi:hypothetical protein
MPRTESKTESKLLRTAGEVIEALGAPAIAQMTGRPAKRVWDWREAGGFPSRYFLVMWVELVSRGYAVSPALWGQTLSRKKEAVLIAAVRCLPRAA